MHQVSVPTCYFPSTALFLDDSRDFLLNFVLQLDEGVAYRIFDAPQKALDYIHHKQCALELVSQYCAKKHTEVKIYPLTHHTLNSELAAIHAEVYNPHRFAEISVVVVDYAMPGMDGLEFCRRIENNNIKKILLTGQADEQLAIAAFHEGLIHRYIKKSDVHAAELITKSIYELQGQYFQAMSDMVVRLLSVSPPRCLQDRTFVLFFNEFRKKHGIIEYYLLDEAGSFFMLDEDANVSFLIIKRPEDLQSHQEFAKSQGANADLLVALIRGKKIPGFWQTNGSWDDWLQCLVPAERLVADTETFYYAFLSGKTVTSARQQKILSYHRYLEELDAEELLTE